jgi:hypothetical protein
MNAKGEMKIEEGTGMTIRISRDRGEKAGFSWH